MVFSAVLFTFSCFNVHLLPVFFLSFVFILIFFSLQSEGKKISVRCSIGVPLDGKFRPRPQKTKYLVRVTAADRDESWVEETLCPALNWLSLLAADDEAGDDASDALVMMVLVIVSSISYGGDARRVMVMLVVVTVHGVHTLVIVVVVLVMGMVVVVVVVTVTDVDINESRSVIMMKVVVMMVV